MSEHLPIPAERMAVVPLGINMIEDYETQPRARAQRRADFTIGYFATDCARERAAPPRRGLRAAPPRDTGVPESGSRRQGISAAAHKPYLARRAANARAGGVAGRLHVSWRGRSGRQARVPAQPGRAVGAGDVRRAERDVRCSKRWRAACRSSQPRRGAFMEIVERTGGGLLVEPDDPDASPTALCRMCERPASFETELGRRGRGGSAAALH